MTKVFDIMRGVLHHHYPEYETTADTIGRYAPTIVFVDAPDDATEGWGYAPDEQGDDRFVRPATDGFYFLSDPPTTYIGFRESEYARALEQADGEIGFATAMVEDDTEHDWASYKTALEQYRAGIMAVKQQAGYPKNPVYPEHPTIPWEDANEE